MKGANFLQTSARTTTAAPTGTTTGGWSRRVGQLANREAEPGKARKQAQARKVDIGRSRLVSCLFAPPSASSLLLRRPDASRRPGSLIGANGRAAAGASPACRLAGRQSALEFRAQSLRNKSALASAQVLACVSPAALTHTHTVCADALQAKHKGDKAATSIRLQAEPEQTPLSQAGRPANLGLWPRQLRLELERRKLAKIGQ